MMLAPPSSVFTRYAIRRDAGRAEEGCCVRRVEWNRVAWCMIARLEPRSHGLTIWNERGARRGRYGCPPATMMACLALTPLVLVNVLQGGIMVHGHPAGGGRVGGVAERNG